MKKIKGTTKGIILLSFFGLVLLLSTIILLKNRVQTTEVEQASIDTEDYSIDKNTEPIEATPSLTSKLDYSIQEFDSQWSILSSENLGFSIRIPVDSEVNRGGGFDRNAPETETVQWGINLPDELANAVVVLDIGNTLSRSSEQIAESITELTGPAGFTYTRPEEKSINNSDGYETFATGENNLRSYHYVTTVDDIYIDLWYYYPWNGRETTGNEEEMVNQVISTFKLLDE